MMFASLMMSASPNVLWQTSHHCEYNEQHHYSKNNIISLKAMHHYVLSSPLREIWVVFYFVRRGPQPSKSRVRDGTAILCVEVFSPPHLSPVFYTFSIKRMLFTAFYTKSIDMLFFGIYNLYSIFTKYVKMQGVPQAIRIAVENLMQKG